MVLAFLLGCIGLQAVPDPSGSDSGALYLGDVELSATSVDFGDVELGVSGEQALVFTNVGNQLVQVVAAVEGEGFSSSAAAFDLLAGADQVVTLSFTPEELGRYSGDLVVEVGTDSSRVALEGRGVEEGGGGTDTGSGAAGEISTDRPSLDFGTLDLYQSSMLQLKVGNSGTAPLTISSATCADSAFVLTGNLTPPRTLDPGEERTIEVTFTPSVEKSYSSKIVLESDDPGSPRTEIAVAGVGENACDICSPIIAVETGGSSNYAIDDFFSLFGSKDTRTVTIGNDGDEDLDVSRVEVNNDVLATCGTFTLSGWAGATSVKPGRTTSFDISYTTTDACLDVSQKAFDANVAHILSNDPSEPDYVIELGGSGLWL